MTPHVFIKPRNKLSLNFKYFNRHLKMLNIKIIYIPNCYLIMYLTHTHFKKVILKIFKPNTTKIL